MEGREIAIFCAQSCADFKGDDIQVLDLRGLTDVADYFVIASFDSLPQMKAVVDSISREAKVRKVSRLGVEGADVGRWVLMDFIDCVIHLFDPEVRRYYELETLWGDAPRVSWESEDVA